MNWLKLFCLSTLLLNSACSLYSSQENFIQNGTPIITTSLVHESQDLVQKIQEIQSCKYYPPVKSSATTQKEKRIALIITNSDYLISSLNLQSTKEDGIKVAHELSKSNFEVILCQNSPLLDIETITYYFIKSKIHEDEIPLTMIFYYSGHGVIIPSFEETLKNNREYHSNLSQKVAKKIQRKNPIKPVLELIDSNDEISIKIQLNTLARQQIKERLTKPLCEYDNKPQEKTSSYLVPSDICKIEEKGLAKSYSKDNLFSVNNFLKNLANQLKLSQNKKAFIIIDACNSPPDDIIEYETISNFEIKGGKVSLNSSLAAPDFSVIDLEKMLVLYGATPGSFSGANKDVGGILTSHFLEGIRNGVSATSILYEASSATTQTNEEHRNDGALSLKNLGFPWLIGATGMFMDFYFRPIYQSTLPWN